MTKPALTLAIVLAASSAAAQPAAQRPCAVTIVRAPAEVRTVVESWVQAEPRCSATLEIRIVPTDGGLYLLARDDYGRVRERVVPDAQSAGVLVASWVAADSSSPQTPYDVRNPTPVPPSAMIGSEGLLAPGEGAAPGASSVITAKAPAPRAPRWLSLGGMFAMSGTGGGGIRGELDLKTKKLVTFGIAASASSSGLMIYGPTYEWMGTLETFDGKLLGYASIAAHTGRWHFGSSLGAGVVYTRAVLDQPVTYTYREAAGVFPTAEVSVSVTRDLGARWAISMAPIASLYVQEYEIESGGADFYSSTLLRRDLELMMFIGLRHRL